MTPFACDLTSAKTTLLENHPFGNPRIVAQVSQPKAAAIERLVGTPREIIGKRRGKEGGAKWQKRGKGNGGKKGERERGQGREMGKEGKKSLVGSL